MKWQRTNGLFLLLLPAYAFLLLAGGSFILAFIESTGNGEGFTWSYYLSLFDRRELTDGLTYSIWITVSSTVVSLITGWLIVRSFYRLIDGNAKWLVWIPMLFPHFVWGYFVLLLLGQSGLISTALVQSGLLEDRTLFPVLVQDRSGIGIFITYVWKEIPFVILMLLPVYLQLPRQFREVNTVLGGGQRHWFKTVEWPWIKPVMFETGLIITAFIFTAYEVPGLLGVSYPQMTPVIAYDWFYSASGEERSMAFALLMLAAFILGACALTGFALMNKRRMLLSKSSHRY
ncbi:ABC transporter permease [Jeotgalibacillus terrae]|uniref:ABC transporter permease n=1 Tax=Jeotgalibacillus terrae TaxID=587735 RepID=A0ABW5ZE67_9BACL|nr:ABC transporter permease subunit [Jeotgalibacillus terrae]MBM7579478.1 putative spermidine/putrescine transport system permease protein [Jeotgalibacillus terrae]